MSEEKHPFYDEGLRFECVRCSRCCRHEPGYVFLSENDISGLSTAHDCSRSEFMSTFCTVVSVFQVDRISLKEKDNYDCIFWDDGGCTVYEHRPLQCRSFPFWGSSLASEQAWQELARDCPGIGRGTLHTKDSIELWVRLRAEEGYAVP